MKSVSIKLLTKKLLTKSWINVLRFFTEVEVYVKRSILRHFFQLINYNFVNGFGNLLQIISYHTVKFLTKIIILFFFFLEYFIVVFDVDANVSAPLINIVLFFLQQNMNVFNDIRIK